MALAFFKHRDYYVHRAKIAKYRFCVRLREHDKRLNKVETIVSEVLAGCSKRFPQMEIVAESELGLEARCQVEAHNPNPIEPDVGRSPRDR